MFIFTLLGIALIILSIYQVIAKNINAERVEYNTANGEGNSYNDKNLMPMFLPTKWWMTLIIGVVIGIAGYSDPISVNDAGNRQVVQTLEGKLYVKFTPGIYISGPFSKVTTWPNNFTIQISREEHSSPDADLWVVSDKKDGTFSEGDNAELEHTVKWDLPNVEAMMIDLHVTYNNVGNLMSTTLLSYQKKVASFSTQRLSSEAHYSGGKSQLDAYFQDQLRNGIVLLETETKTKILTDGSSKTYIAVEPRVDSNGVMLRMKSDIQTFGILSTYTSMDNVHYTPEIDLKLKEKIRYAAEEANSKQELITEQQKEQTAIVKGRKLIAETTAREEALEQEAFIQARKAKLVAGEKLEEDKFKAASILALKKAEADGDRLKVAAGLSPKEKADIEKETRIGVAKAMAGPNGIVFPMIVTGGSDGGGGALQTMELKMFYDLMNEMSK